MKIHLIAFFTYFLINPHFTHASEELASFDFPEITLSQLAHDAFTVLLKKDYVADNEFINDTSSISLRVTKKTLAEFEQIIINSIEDRGYEVSENDNLITIRKQQFTDRLKESFTPSMITPKIIEDTEPKEPQYPFYYKMKHRDMQYFVSLLNNIYPKNQFSFTDQSQDQSGFTFKGTQDEIDQLQELLAQIDTKPEQAQINAYMLEVSKTHRKETAFRLAANLLGAALNIDIATQLLGNIISLKTNNFNLALSAINQDARFNILSSPSIFVKDRQQGRISVGADVPVLSQVSFQQNGTPVQSVEYRPSGVILDIKPRFMADNIELTINHQLSSFTPTTTGVNNSPTLIKRQFSSVINAQNEDIILIGGLTETKVDKNRLTNPIVPFLSSSNTARSDHSELLLMLHVKRI